ncbi:hypothetical protein COV24_01620 [candidate division WWE3 bacterium CG10_big_fil_rev_8_21_14_0_10_32_10]|uniref:CopG family transcriptional regulator n=1 Tax=candidate division WWE3 bacterium CG10_big_fil_rev_8_21_14_0_10_32_10 TaxID=1975090 RepID=A0A2H0RAU2_UNCKA|nr:MAG: hypothetical protein COV24_01620 [candidate division WWE3 bacterium CG10_big_fil_rev_8_21_14_0_10_32_10]
MERTQIYLKKEQGDFLKEQAYKNKTSVSKFIRHIVDLKMQEEVILKRKKGGADYLMDLVNEVEREDIYGPKDLAKNHDKYTWK